MTSTWLEPEDVIVPKHLIDAIDGHPLVAETLVRRGIIAADQVQAFLFPEHYLPSPANDLPGLETAALRIIQAIDSGETILVWGDFDVDGQTSTTLLVEGLRELGAKVDYHIPIRASEGHGIRVDVLEQILSKNPTINLLLTCDTGISAFEAVEFTNKKHVDVVITDHHDLPDLLPSAHAIINPKQLDQKHPLATLPGVGVAYKLIEMLFDRLSPTTKGDLSREKYLDLVALGIVADVAELRGESRYLLQRGLNVLRNTKRLGLQTLMEVTQLIPGQLDEEQIGFIIAPRLNALGRLSDANPIVEFLISKDINHSRVFVTQLEGLNERRKLLTEQITQAVLGQINRDHSLIEQAVLVFAHPGWHTGVIGIVASRMVERFGKPTIIFSIGEDGIARGSARSIEGIHIAEVIATQKELLIQYGGHPGAAGLSLPKDALPSFRRGLGQAIIELYGDESPEQAVKIDAYLPLADISLDLADEIGLLAPFGAGNPPLNLASRNITLTNHTPIGQQKNHLRLVVSDPVGNHLNLVWWNGVGNPLPEKEILFDLIYTIKSSTYRGERQLQVQWKDFRSTMEVIPNIDNTTLSIEVIDHRNEVNPLQLLNSIQSEHRVQVWAEGDEKHKLCGSDRYELIPNLPIVVWTIPPSPFEWRRALEQVKPRKLFLFAVNPKMDDPKEFLERLGGLIKFSIRTKEGQAPLKSLATATCQQENTVRMGLLWLEAKGIVQVYKNNQSTYWFRSGSKTEKEDLAEISSELKFMLAEAAAYRDYFKTTLNNLTE